MLWTKGKARNQLTEVLHLGTDGKFHLVEYDELRPQGRLLFRTPLDTPRSTAELRHHLRQAALECGLDPEAAFGFELAVGEAAANAYKHAKLGVAEIYLQSRALVVRVEDQGPGIRPEDLPDSVLEPGHSTAGTLGLGYTLMVQLVDSAWLATGPEGTVLELEKTLEAPGVWPR